MRKKLEVKCSFMSLAWESVCPLPPNTHTQNLHTGEVHMWAAFLPALRCKDDLQAPGSKESPYTQVWHYSVRKACWESSQDCIDDRERKRNMSRLALLSWYYVYKVVKKSPVDIKMLVIWTLITIQIQHKTMLHFLQNNSIFVSYWKQILPLSEKRSIYHFNILNK